MDQPASPEPSLPPAEPRVPQAAAGTELPASPSGPSVQSPVTPRKRSAWPWLLGGCGCLTILLIIAAVVLVGILKVRKEAKRAFRSGDESSWTSFVSTPDNIPAALRDHFIRFSFKYPDNFRVMPQSASNFVKLEEVGSDDGGGKNFAVGPAWFPPDADNNDVYPQLLSQLSPQLAQGFANYKEIGQVPETVGGLRGRALLFQGESAEAGEAKATILGKLLVVRQPKQKDGVIIAITATASDPEIENAGDVGTKGDLARILRSFKLL